MKTNDLAIYENQCSSFKVRFVAPVYDNLSIVEFVNEKDAQGYISFGATEIDNFGKKYSGRFMYVSNTLLKKIQLKPLLYKDLM